MTGPSRFPFRAVALAIFGVAFLAEFCSTGAVAQGVAGYDAPADLWSESTLYRDEWGVPHVFADNARAMAFAFGYAQAEDHLEPMLIAYRLANGRAAEVLGEELVEADRLAIRLDHAGLAAAAYESADAVTRDLCEGFAFGVNTWITDHPDRAPEWAEGVHPADILALFHRYLLSQAPFDYADAFHMLPSTPSANAWAVGPQLSQSGDAMLVINPHAGYDNAYQWYEAHLVTNDMNAYGATLFGLPVIVQGHNTELGWAFSPNYPDTADLFVELAPEIDEPRNPKSVMPQRTLSRRAGMNYTERENRPMYVWTPQGFREEWVDRANTWRGPIVANVEGQKLSWRVAGYEDFGGIRQLHDMALARDLDGFQRVLDRQQVSPFHVVYADRTGNIYYQYDAKTGIRQDVRTEADAFTLASNYGSASDVYLRPLTTQQGVYDWGETLAPDAMPWLLNPPSGYVQACGSPPWLATSPSALDPAGIPPWLVRDSDSYRAKRVRRLFSLGKRSFDDMQAMLFDTVSPLAAEAVPFLLRAAADYPEFVDQAHPDVQVGLEMLAEWNYLADPGSLAMTFFHVWWTILRRDESGAPRDNEVMHRLIMEDAQWFREYALQSAADAAALLRDEFQTLNVPWGEVHVIQRGDRVEPIGGAESGEPIFATGDRMFDDSRWYASGGYGFAMIVRFGDWPEAVSVVPFGSSENPESKHFDDQMDLLLARRFKRTRFHRDDVERHAESATGRRLLLRPREQDGTVYVSASEPLRARLGEAWDSPVGLPPGLAAFTSFIEPVVEHIPPGLVIEVDLSVSEAICAAENLDSLYIYGYSPVDGWREVESQSIDVDRNVFLADLSRPQCLAVLGPARYQLANPRSVAAAAPPPPAPPRSRIVKPSDESAPGSLPEPGELTRIARNDDASVTSLSQADTERVASIDAPGPPVLVPHNPDQPELEPPPPNLRVGRFPMALPAVPPGFRPDIRDVVPPGAAVNTAPRAFSPLPAQSVETALPDWEREDPPVSQGAPVLSPALPQEDLSPAAASGPAGSAAGENADEVAEPDATSEVTREAAASPLPAAGERSRVSFSDQTPREILAREGVTQESFELAPDPSRASQMGVGTSLELRTPDGALFTVRAKQQVRAQAYAADAPPAPFPDALELHSPIYVVRALPDYVQANTAIVLHAQSGAAIPDLKLYVLDRDQGWIPLPGHRGDPVAGTFSGIDFGVRAYALLAPR